MRRNKNFGFLMFPDVEELDLVGPWEIVNIWRELTGEPENCLLISADGAETLCAAAQGTIVRLQKSPDDAA